MTIAREKLQEKQKNITETLERLDYKINLYTEIEEGKRKDFTEVKQRKQIIILKISRNEVYLIDNYLFFVISNLYVTK